MSSGQSRIYREQILNASSAREIFASGARMLFEEGSSFTLNSTFKVGASGLIDLSTGVGRISFATGEIAAPDLAGDLSSGYITVNLFDAKEAVSASGTFTAITTGTNPALGRVNATVDPSIRVRWTTAAGAQDPLQLPTVALPPDVGTATGITVHLYGEKGSGQASADIDVRAYMGIGDTEMGTTVNFTSSPADRTVAIASGDVVPGTMLNLVLEPAAHASGVIDLYAVWVTYARSS